MKNCFTILSLIAVLTISCSKDDNKDSPPDSQILKGTVDTSQIVSSHVLNQNINYSIYLPPSYNISDIKYPVLYLLHGIGGNHRDWVKNGMATTMNQLITKEAIKEIIVVMPDGRDAFYCNNYNGKNFRYEDFFIGEFLPEIESRYRINPVRQARAIAGLSMGGYGTTFNAFKHPELFSAAYAMSAAFDLGTTAPDLRSIVDEKISNHIILPSYTMECGTEDFLFSSNQSFHQFLGLKNIDHTYTTRSGTHDWNFWNTCLPKALSFINIHFEK